MELLLALGVGMAWVALIFCASLAQIGADHAPSPLGADVRITATRVPAGGDVAQARPSLARLPGVMGITPVFRGVALGSRASKAPPAGLLVVNPVS